MDGWMDSLVRGWCSLTEQRGLQQINGYATSNWFVETHGFGELAYLLASARDQDCIEKFGRYVRVGGVISLGIRSSAGTYIPCSASLPDQTIKKRGLV